jgi:carbon storage regulator
MLILTRRINESIIIGDDIKITIKDINRGNARIGIEAPDHIIVDREEVRERREKGFKRDNEIENRNV